MFAILLSSTESQGFAIQEMMANNLPLLVWDKKNSDFEGISITGSSISYWDNKCGLIVDSYAQLEESFDDFTLNLKNYYPVDLIKRELTFEKFQENLFNQFNNF